MARVKRTVNAQKKKRKVMRLAKGYLAARASSIALAANRFVVLCAMLTLAAS